VPVAPAPHIVASWDEALAALRSRSTDLRIALDEIERSDAQWRQALALSLPTLTGSGNLTWNVVRNNLCSQGICGEVPNAVTYGATIALTQPAFAPRAWHAARTANLAVGVAALSAEDQKRVLTIALANAVVSVVTAERISEINRVGLRAALDRLTLARRRVALGAGNALDTVRADQDVSVARSAVVTGDESLRQARETLGLALGSADPWGVPPDINLNGVEASARATCASAATLEERADIAAARGTTEIARRNVDDARLRFSPTVDLVSNFGLIGSEQTARSVDHRRRSDGAVLRWWRALRRRARKPGAGRRSDAATRSGAPRGERRGHPGPARGSRRRAKPRRGGALARSRARDRKALADRLPGRQWHEPGSHRIGKASPRGRDPACAPGVRPRAGADRGASVPLAMPLVAISYLVSSMASRACSSQSSRPLDFR